MLPGRAGARRVRAAFHGYARAACEHTCRQPCREYPDGESAGPRLGNRQKTRSEEHTSNSSHLVISYAVFCLKKKNNQIGEGYDAQNCHGLRRPERVTRLVVVELAGNPDGAGVQVDVFRTERGESAHRRLVKAASRISAR